MTLKNTSLLVAVVLFLGLTIYQINLPGLHYDEAFEAVPAMQILLHQPANTFRDNGILLAGQRYPFMTQDYIGAINTYAAIPFLLILGPTTASVRLMTIFLGILTLFLLSQFAFELYGPWPSAVAVLLLAVNPSFVFWSRQGVFVTSVAGTIGIGAALAWLRWWRTGSIWYATAGAFLLGLGLYAKFLFLWMLLALGLTALLLGLGQWIRKPSNENLPPVLRNLDPKFFAFCGLAFLLGVAPLIAYNMQTGGTFSSVGSNLTTSYYGTNNLAILNNLAERIKQLGVVLIGNHFWYLGDRYANWLNLGLFAASLLSTIWITIRRLRRSSEVRRALVPFCVVGGIVATSCGTVSALWVTHFAILTPWLPLTIAAAVYLLACTDSRSRPVGKAWKALPAVLVVAISLVWLGDVAVDLRYHQALRTSGGLGSHSDAIQDLADWLKAAHSDVQGPTVAMDWGIAAPVTYLTRGEVTPVEAFGYEWETGVEFDERLSRFVGDPSSIYLWRAPDEIIFDRSHEFQLIYRPLGLEEDILEAFYERSGRPVLGATRLVIEGTAVNPPRP